MEKFQKLFQVKKLKRFLTLMLAVAMFVTAIPTNVFAAEVLETVVEDDTLQEIESVSDSDEEELSTTLITMELEEKEKTAVYNGGAVLPRLDEDSLRKRVKVTVDGEEVEVNSEDITLTWKVKNAEGVLTDLPRDASVPINAGTYYLMVTLKAREGMYENAEIEGGVPFTITPAKISVEPKIDEVQTGTRVGEIKVAGAKVTSPGTVFQYIVDDPLTDNVDESEYSHIEITIQRVREAADLDRTPLETGTVLESNKDYVLDFEASFTKEGELLAAGNYEVDVVVSQDVKMSPLISSYINVTLIEEWKDQDVITYEYTGEAITAPEWDTDYIAKVQYLEGIDEEGNLIFKDIDDAEIIEDGWYELIPEHKYLDLNGNAEVDWEWVKMEDAPVEAGKYIYRLFYEGKEGLYQQAAASIDVVIEPIEVVIVPEWIEPLKDFYDEMTEADVLSQIDYQIYAASDKNRDWTIEVDRDIVWGTSTAQEQQTQPYEPVFLLQYQDMDQDGNIIYVNNQGALLDHNRVYRVLFGGTKAVVQFNGTVWQELPINQVVNTTSLNYVAVTDYASASENALNVVVNEGIKTTIDISEIQNELGAKGESLDHAYRTVFTGHDLYETKADYKKAIVEAGNEIVAEETDAPIEYRWYCNADEEGNLHSITDYIFNSNNELYGEDEENIFDDSWVLCGEEGYTVPSQAGVYKLEISYKDWDNPQYLASVANVYYVIEKQPVKVTLNKECEYKAFAGESISDFFERFFEDEKNLGEIQKLIGIQFLGNSISENTISGNSWINLEQEIWEDEWEIEYSVLETTMVEETDNKGNSVLVPKTTEVYHYCPRDLKRYWVFGESGNQITKEDEKEYTCYSDRKFNKNAQYKLTATLKKYGTNNYDNEQTVIKRYNIETSEGIELHLVREYETWQDKVPITVVDIGTTQLSVSINEIELEKKIKEKVYDGIAFDKEELLDGAVFIVKKEDGSLVTDIEVDYTWSGPYWNSVLGELQNREGFDEAIHVGDYQLYVSYGGDETYAPLRPYKITDVKITKAKITATPRLAEDVVAGILSMDVWRDEDFQSQILFQGVAKADREAFIYNQNNGFRAFAGNMPFTIHYEEEPVPDDVRLRGEQVYTLIAVDDSLVKPYLYDYEIEVNDVIFKTIRGLSNVSDLQRHLRYEYFTNQGVEEAVRVPVYVTQNGYHHNVEAHNAIPYSYYANSNGDRVYGNFLEVRIDIPTEYSGKIPGTAKYENAIEAQGGIVQEEVDENNGWQYLAVIMDASQRDTKTFAIRWEDGYVEEFTFDFSQADLMGNLADAVAPKSIAFNSPVKRMAVGEVQELDLKLKKVQFNDVICISYTVNDESVLSVDQHGRVTALKVGSATVTATPVRIVEGRKVAIEGAKKASVKLTVTPVTSPRIRRLVPLHNKAIVQYSVLPDGYRREVYVLKGKNIKANVFEEKIAQMNYGQWEGIFAIQPVVYPEGEEPHALNRDGTIDNLTCEIELEGLEYNTDYTLYLRNVSEARKAENGNDVTLSAGGTARGFKTTKAQVEELRADLEEADFIVEDEHVYYLVRLSEGKVSMTIEGRFDGKEMDIAMDRGDAFWASLPLNKDLKKIYVDPKLTYAVYEARWEYDEEEEEWIIAEFVPTELASVDRKGNVKLEGVGTVYVEVRDTNTGHFDMVELQITATADRVTGGKRRLSVGEAVTPEELLTYYEGKKRLIGDYARGVDLEDSTLLEAFADNEFFELDVENRLIRAVKAGGKLEIELTDVVVRQNEGQATAKVTLNSAALEPVRNLRIANAENLRLGNASLTNNYAIVQFTYTGHAEAFKVDVEDGRGRLIRSSYVTREFMRQSGRIRLGNDNRIYFVLDIPNLTQQSKYKISVTAKYNNISAKTAKISVKTTKLPASRLSLQDDQMNAGLQISVLEDGQGVTILGGRLSNGKSLISGNTYTFRVNGNAMSENMGADSLIWNSTDRRVATVKANSGTFGATFKALRAGDTTIEVRSKITKEIIARWFVIVDTVGDAYARGRRYYEDNTPNGLDNEQILNNVILEEGVYTSISVEARTGKWIAYTVPTNGVYNFSLNNSRNMGLEVYNTLKERIAVSDGANTWVHLQAKQKVYLRLINNNTVTVNMGVMPTIYPVASIDPMIGLSVPSGLDVNSYFIAEEDGIYEIQVKGTETSNIVVYDNPNIEGTSVGKGTNNLLFEMNKGQTYYFKISGTTFDESNFKVSVSKFQPKQLTMDSEVNVTAEPRETKWVVFIAPETNVYTFKVQKNGESQEVSNYVGFYQSALGELKGSVFGDGIYEYTLQAGEELYLKVEGKESQYEADVTLSVSKLPLLTVGKETSVSLEEKEKQWYVFHALETGCYKFIAETEDENSGSSLYLYKNKKASSLDGESKKQSAEASYVLEAGETLYVNVGGYNNKAADLKLSVVKANTETIGNEEITSNLLAEEEKYYEYTVLQNGVYSISVGSEIENAAKVTVYTNSQGKLGWNLMATNPMQTKEILLTAGTKLYLRVTNASVESSISLKVVKTAMPEVTEEKTVELTAEKAWFSFTAPETAEYIFTAFYGDDVAKNGSNRMAYYVLAEDGLSYIKGNEYTSSVKKPLKCKISLEAGETLLWQVTGTEEYPVTVKVTNSVQTLTLDKGVDINLTAGEEGWFTFTVPETGKYSFYSVAKTSCDSVGYFYWSKDSTDAIDSNDDGNATNSSGQFKLDKRLMAGHTIFLKVKAYRSYEGVNATVYVTKQ